MLVPGPLPLLYKEYRVANPAREGLALPSTFIIDRTGVVRWQHVGKNDFDRVKSATIVEQLTKLQ